VPNSDSAWQEERSAEAERPLQTKLNLSPPLARFLLANMGNGLGCGTCADHDGYFVSNVRQLGGGRGQVPHRAHHPPSSNINFQ
jgi:hypothetical protein